MEVVPTLVEQAADVFVRFLRCELAGGVRPNPVEDKGEVVAAGLAEAWRRRLAGDVGERVAQVMTSERDLVHDTAGLTILALLPLRTLSLARARHLSHEALLSTAHLWGHGLLRVDIRQTRVDGEILARLGTSPAAATIEDLDLSRCLALTDADLLQLRWFPRLRKLRSRGNNFTPAGCGPLLAEACPQLEARAPPFRDISLELRTADPMRSEDCTPLLLFLVSAWSPRGHRPPAADVIGREAEVPLPRLTSLVTKGMTCTFHAFSRLLRERPGVERMTDLRVFPCLPDGENPPTRSVCHACPLLTALPWHGTSFLSTASAASTTLPIVTERQAASLAKLAVAFDGGHCDAASIGQLLSQRQLPELRRLTAHVAMGAETITDGSPLLLDDVAPLSSLTLIFGSPDSAVALNKWLPDHRLVWTLRRLSLVDCSLDCHALAHIGRLNRLERLSLDSMQIKPTTAHEEVNEAFARMLATLVELRRLALEQLTFNGVAEIEVANPRLERLTLGLELYPRLRVRCANLRRLSVNEPRQTLATSTPLEAIVASLSPRLEHLYVLWDCLSGDQFHTILARGKQLRRLVTFNRDNHLSVAFGAASAADTAATTYDMVSKLERLTIQGSDMDDRTLCDVVASSPRLWRLDLEQCSAITTIEQLRSTSLRSLCLNSMPALSGSLVPPGTPNLTSLDVTRHDTLPEMVGIAHQPHLLLLRCSFTISALELNNLPRLREAHVSSMSPGSAGQSTTPPVMTLSVARCPRLEELRIKGLAWELVVEQLECPALRILECRTRLSLETLGPEMAMLFHVETQFKPVVAPFRETLARLTVTFDGRIVIAPASAPVRD